MPAFRAPQLSPLRPHAVRGARAAMLALALAGPIAGCAANGPPSAAQLRQEEGYGRQMLQQLQQNDKVVQDRQAQAYLDRILARIQAQRDPALPRLKGTIVDDPGVNAFTTGGGYVFVHTGLLAAMENEAQVSMVLAHETAHVDLGHVTAGRQTDMAVGIVGAIASIGLSAAGVSGSLANPIVNLGTQAGSGYFSREQEREADILGARYHAAAGWNTAEGARSFEVLQRLYGDGGGFLSSHPGSVERLQRVQAIAKAEGADKGDIGAARHLTATNGVRRMALKQLEAEEGRGKEVAQLKRNIAATK